MRDHLPLHQEPPAGGITRSHSYCLARGGKLVSWAADGARLLPLPNMQALDSSGKGSGGKHPPRPPSTDSDSDSGDTFETSEEEAEAGRQQSHYAHYTITEEDLEDSVESEKPAVDGSAGAARPRAGERVPGDGHSPPHIARDFRQVEARDNVASDSDDDDDDVDSESDETESTVRARPGAVSGSVEDSGGAAQTCEQDHNDTLSTGSGDLSLDERDAAGCSPPPQDPADAPHPPAMDQAKRAPPEGERCTLQREGVRAGVFCISGYPRQGAGDTCVPPSTSAPGGHCLANNVDDEQVGDMKRVEVGHQASQLPAPRHSRVALLRSSWHPSTQELAASTHQPSSVTFINVRGDVPHHTPQKQEPGDEPSTISAASRKRSGSTIVTEVHSSRRHQQQPHTHPYHRHRSEPEQQPHPQQEHPGRPGQQEERRQHLATNRKDHSSSPSCNTREASVSGNEDFEWVRTSPMLTGLLEGHVTRLATPPDHRSQSLKSSLVTPPESGEEGSGGPTHRHRQYSRPPPVPRPRTLEAGDLVPHRPIRDAIRDGLRDSRDSLRDRLYSPSRDMTGHRRSRDSSLERSGRDSSCERGSLSSFHQRSHYHLTSHLPKHPCDCPSCWCDDDEPDYDSCDERHHHHRHSYHEGLHHAHLHQFQPHHYQQSGHEVSRERRNRVHGSGDSGRSSPCCCRHCHQLGSLSSLSSHDYCTNNRLTLPCTTKSGSLEDRVNRLEGDKDSLQLQVTVLSEQIEAQTEKITDLEKLLEQKKEQLQNTEEQLQKEVITRSSLETQGLELFSEISNLKLHQAAYERENIELREKIRRSDHQSDHAKAQPVASGAEIVRTGSGRSIAPAASSTPVHSFIVTPDSPQPSHQLAAQLTNSPSPSSISTLSTIPASSPNKSPAQPTTTSPASSPIASHDGREFLPPRTPPPNARRKIEQFGTVPRQRETGVCGENCHGAPAAGRTKGVMFGKGFHFLPFRVAGKRSTSAPNLGDGGHHA